MVLWLWRAPLESKYLFFVDTLYVVWGHTFETKNVLCVLILTLSIKGHKKSPSLPTPYLIKLSPVASASLVPPVTRASPVLQSSDISFLGNTRTNQRPVFRSRDHSGPITGGARSDISSRRPRVIHYKCYKMGKIFQAYYAFGKPSSLTLTIIATLTKKFYLFSTTIELVK